MRVTLAGVMLMFFCGCCLISVMVAADANPIFKVDENTGQIQVCEIGRQCVQLTTAEPFSYSDIKMTDPDFITYTRIYQGNVQKCTMHWRTANDVCITIKQEGE